MKLHRITVENLNSFYGRHAVDLDGALGDPPFFLIVGPTGAGKTTLTDAVMLALYGETPRLTQGRGDDDLKPHHIISRGEGSALAEVEVSRVEADGTRVRYRATWSIHRAHKRPDGEPKPARRTLAVWDPAAGDWREQASSDKKKDLQPAFDALVEGLGAAEFKRSMLLAQGEFAAFIEADDDERAAILERLTATDRYHRVGARAYAKRYEAQRALEAAAGKWAAIEVLDDAALAEATARAEAARAASAAAERAWSEAESAHRWRHAHDQLAAHVTDASERHAAALAAWTDAGPELARLAEHRRCAPAVAPLAARATAERERTELAARLAKLAADEADVVKGVHTSTLALDRARAERLAEEGRWALLAPSIAEARRAGQALALAKAEAARETARAERVRALAERLASDAADAQRSAEEAERSRSAEAATAAHLVERGEERARLLARAAELGTQRQALAAAQDALAWALGVANQRARLTTGAPCPLCGSAHHPYIEDGTHADADRATRAHHATTTAALAACEQDARRVAEALAALQASEARLDAERRAHARQATTHEAAAQAAQARMAEARKSLGLPDDARDAELAALRAEATARATQAADGERVAAVALAQVALAADPELLEAQHRQALERLARAERQHLEAQHAAENRATELGTRRAEATQRAAELTAAMASQDATLAELAATLGLADARALEARLLPTTTAEALARREADLQQRLRHAQTIQDERRRALQASLAEAPTSALGTASQAELRALVAERAATAASARTAHAESAARLQHDTELRRRRDALGAELAPLRAEAALWSELAELIGGNQGADFRKFAQMLNLGDLAARANLHLARLAPRYRLVTPEAEPGKIRLDFAVEDALHAGARRPLTTLSGGESFLLSLALALALAGYRTQRLRIETLLIDEGFGGLDPEALEVSIQALEALHADGLQVGLISHVEAMRDRVDARIVVQPVGGGRSVIRHERAGS